MSNQNNEVVSLAALWITLIASIAFLIQQLAGAGLI
jgi:Na+(H+)/acetate symporter ActP